MDGWLSRRPSEVASEGGGRNFGDRFKKPRKKEKTNQECGKALDEWTDERLARRVHGYGLSERRKISVLADDTEYLPIVGGVCKYLSSVDPNVRTVFQCSPNSTFFTNP